MGCVGWLSFWWLRLGIYLFTCSCFTFGFRYGLRFEFGWFGLFRFGVCVVLVTIDLVGGFVWAWVNCGLECCCWLLCAV